MTMKSERFDLTGKVALVTGGSKGIGRHLAFVLAQQGATVAVASRHIRESQEVADEIQQEGGEAFAVYVDISVVETIAPMVQEVVKRKGAVDILVNNAGTNVRKPAIDFSEAEWNLVLDTNLRGTFFCAQAVAKVMIAQASGGRIINISSAAGGMPVPWLAPYSISKAGINHMTRILAVEWAPYGITVNAIAPSYIETPLTRAWLSDPKRRAMLQGRSPMKRLGRVSDLEGALLLFASDASGFITGQTLFVDGGSTAGWAIDWEAYQGSGGGS